MPNYYRGFSEKSGCTFNEEEGFVAQSQDKIFDMSAPETARIYLEDHLVWANHHIASPLISTSSEWKAINVAFTSQKFWLARGHRVETFVATMQYDSAPSNAYKMLPTAAKLEAQYSSVCNDPNEWIFSGRIPLKYIMEVRRYVFNPSDGQAISSEIAWARSMASPHTLMRSECYESGQRLQNAILSFKTAALKTLGMIPVSERQQAGSLKITHVPGRVHWTVIEVLLRLLWEAWFHDTNEERSMVWNSSVKLTARCLMGSAQILLAMYWKFTSTPTASDPLVKKDIWTSTVKSILPELLGRDMYIFVECRADRLRLRRASMLLIRAAAVHDETATQRPSSGLLKHSAQELVSALCSHVEGKHRLVVIQDQTAAVVKVAEPANEEVIEPESPELELVRLMAKLSLYDDSQEVQEIPSERNKRIQSHELIRYQSDKANALVSDKKHPAQETTSVTS